MAGHIYLTGLSGSGKSTAGPLLAQRMGLPFIDSDRQIEARSQRAIFEIFEQQGEPAFRAYESATLEEIARGPRAVIALGGGALMAPANRMLIQQTGTLVYLNADPRRCAERLAGTSETRPLLAPSPAQRLEEQLLDLFVSRRSLYERADVVVDANEGTAGDVAERICALLPEAPSA